MKLLEFNSHRFERSHPRASGPLKTKLVFFSDNLNTHWQLHTALRLRLAHSTVGPCQSQCQWGPACDPASVSASLSAVTPSRRAAERKSQPHWQPSTFRPTGSDSPPAEALPLALALAVTQAQPPPGRRRISGTEYSILWNNLKIPQYGIIFPYCGILITQYGIRVGLITQYGMSRIPYCAIESIEFHCSMESMAQYGIQAFHTVQLNP